MKKYLLLIFLLSTSLTLNTFFTLNAYEFNPEEQEPIGDAPLFQRQCISPEALIAILSEVRILDVLQQDLYLRTNPINVRSLLDLPALTPYYFYNDNFIFTAELFYNQTRLAYFTESSPSISSYIALQDAQLTGLLKEIIEEVNDTFETSVTSDIPQILSLFKDIKIEERRAGLMFGFAKQWCFLHFSLLFPFYYLEHNFFLTESEQDRIKNAPFFKQDGTSVESDENEAQAYFKTHLVNDRLGIGDTRLNLQGHVFHAYQTDAWLGIETTIPTGATLHEAYVGGEFDELACTPPFSLLNLAQCFNERNQLDEFSREATPFLEGALDRLSVLLLDIPPGNGGFFGLGPKFDMANYINANWTIHTYIAYEHYFKSNQIRFFLKKKNPENFDRELNPSSEEEALADIAFLNQQVINTFYPDRSFAIVQPGGIFKFRNSLLLDTDRWHARLGIDYWRQNCETLFVDAQDQEKLLIERGLKPKAEQLKIYTTVGIYGSYCDICYNVMIDVDGTIVSRGIGKDFTIGLRAGFEF